MNFIYFQMKLNIFFGICNQIISGKKASCVLDDFILQDYIGSGGFGKVYKVKYKKQEKFMQQKSQ